MDNHPGTLEPESVAFSKNSRFAYITLQENSGVVRLDLHTSELTFFGLGQTSHDADLIVDGFYNPFETLEAYREPDGISLDQTGRFFVTADEGDSRSNRGGSEPEVLDLTHYRGMTLVAVGLERANAGCAD
ncbi:hypothetical protein [Methyloglobulus sp.]|uniref:hypothetical protein n=1 Tax=Methyloglobulus sp. TaxID=2518622 RepID=UPI003988A705